MELGLKGLKWKELGVVDTIYEDEDEDSDPSSISTINSPTPQFSGVKPRFLVRSDEPDVVIHVQDSCFRLHKEVLTARSSYLKRQLIESSEITLSPPLKITAETFSLVTDFCYGTYVAITVFNVAALLTAAKLLEMTETNGPENLVQKTENYFCRTVAVNKEYAAIVLQSSLSLLPEAETTASLVSRCVEALSLMGEADGDLSFLDGVKGVQVEDLQLILESTSKRLTDSHDLLYRIIEIYLKENNGKLSEQQKMRMCNYIDCTILSPRTLMHAVQNPTMPLRFVVQSMFVEQLNTRRSIVSSIDHHKHDRPKKESITLGAILCREAALRQAEQMKATMRATSSRIQTLEKELNDMKNVLNESKSIIGNETDSRRSSSFRLSTESDQRGVERGQIGSISSISYREFKKNVVGVEGSFSSEGSYEGSLNVEKKFGRGFIGRLKSAFRLQSLVLKKN